MATVSLNGVREVKDVTPRIGDGESTTFNLIAGLEEMTGERRGV